MPNVTPHDIAILLVSGASLLAVAFGRVARFRLDRAAVAAVGATLVMLIDHEGAGGLWRAIDGQVLLLLFAVMVVNAGLTDAGVFRYLAVAVTSRGSGPRAVLLGLVVVAGFLSALFLNDAVVIMLTPLVVTLARRVDVHPLPFLLALAMAANAGSAATLTGNPQNVVVGLAAHIGYLRFAAALAPVAALSLLAVCVAVLVLFRRELRAGRRPEEPSDPPPVDGRRLATAGVIALGMLSAFLAGVPPAEAALAAAAAVLLNGPRRAGILLGRVDFKLPVLFAGLFVIVGAMAATPLAAALLNRAGHAGTARFVVMVALASNLLSNVPAVMVLLPAATRAGASPSALLLAMASTLAGNLTLAGSVANLIVAESARRLDVELDFLSYARVGVPVTVVTLALGTLWLLWR